MDQLLCVEAKAIAIEAFLEPLYDEVLYTHHHLDSMLLEFQYSTDPGVVTRLWEISILESAYERFILLSRVYGVSA